MRGRTVLSALILWVSALPARAGPSGAADPHAKAATGFPGDYVATISLALTENPSYGEQFLDSLQIHMRSVAAMTSPEAVAGYLEQAASGGRPLVELRPQLGKEILPSPNMGALLIADALYQPSHIVEIFDGLETLKSGLGRHSAAAFRGVSGRGNKRIIAALRSAGSSDPKKNLTPFASDQRWAPLFDATGGSDPDQTQYKSSTPPRPSRIPSLPEQQ